MIPVRWVDYPAPGKDIVRGYWDQGLLEDYFAGRLHRARYTFDHRLGFDDRYDGAVVVCPGRFHHDQVDRLNSDLAELPWVLLLVVSDEERLFPLDQVRHHNIRTWVMTPRPGDPGDRFLGEYLPPHAAGLIHPHDGSKTADWFVSCQVNHDRRRRMARALAGRPECVTSDRFAGGLDPADYYARLAEAKIAPAPAGPATPDSFRAYEALEAGCVPIVDATCPAYGTVGYWDLLGAPLPTLDHWDRIDAAIAEQLALWPDNANRCFAWWQQHKRQVARRLDADIRDLSTDQGAPDPITVVVPTSPIPSHPDPSITLETLRSVREQLPDADVLVCFDGVRPELTARAGDYAEYVRRLLWEINTNWPGVTPLRAEEHVHQGGLMRLALDHIDTPCVVFVEHDTPIVGHVPWTELTAAVTGGHADLVRLHHEAEILAPHRHMMIDALPLSPTGVPMKRTWQWSQRPHIASTAFYRRVIARYFGRDSRTMIEDVMHGVVENAWMAGKLRSWDEWRLWIYAPDGDMKRSTHLDGRGADPKFEERFVFAYDDDSVPPGAPYPTAWRVD